MKRLRLKAVYPKGLDSVNITSGTIRGLICSSWTNKNGRMSWKVSVPVNSKASVYIPYAADRTITEGGKKNLDKRQCFRKCERHKMERIRDRCRFGTTVYRLDGRLW